MNKKTDGKDQKKIILYLGDDAGYWGTIKSRITQKLAGKAFEIHSVALKNTTNYQVVHLEVLKLAPQIIYLDFSTNLEFSLKLAHLLKRENSLKQTPVIGLVEKKKNIADCIFAGIEFIHLKCGEYHDIIYDGFFLAFPGEVQEPDFAKAQFERDATLICDMRLGFVTADSIHAEGNVNIAPDTTITINSEIPIKMIPSNKFICKEVTDFNLYYDYKYNYEFQFLFIDQPEFDDQALEKKLEGLDENQRVLIIKTTKENRRDELNDYKERLKKTKKDVASWIVDNMDRIKPKKTKILIIDKELKFLYDPKSILSDFPFTIRTQTHLNEDLKDIKVLRPDIISFQFFDLKKIKKQVEEEFESGVKEDGTPYIDQELKFAKEELLKNKIDDGESQALDQLSLILKTIKSLDNYKPFIILFNCHSYSSQSIQESFKYPFVIVNKNQIDLSAIINMATMLEKRNDTKMADLINSKVEMLKKSDPKKYRTLSSSEFEEKRYYLSNKNSLSQISTSFPIILRSMTESDLTFSSQFELDIGTYRLDFPVAMSIRIVPIGGNTYELDGDNRFYRALIHSVGEEDKKKIRQFVNEIFFSELSQKRLAEENAFKELNEGEQMKRIQEMEKIEAEDAAEQSAIENPENVVPDDTPES